MAAEEGWWHTHTHTQWHRKGVEYEREKEKREAPNENERRGENRKKKGREVLPALPFQPVRFLLDCSVSRRVSTVCCVPSFVRRDALSC